MKEYKLKKKTCVYGYETLDMILQQYLQDRKEGTLYTLKKAFIVDAVIIYNRLDAIDWIIQLKWVCQYVACDGKINILSKVLCKCNLTTLDKLLDCNIMCFGAASCGHLETLKWLRKYNAKWDEDIFEAARDGGYDEIVQYLRAEGCPEPFEEDTDESLVGSDNEDGDY